VALTVGSGAKHFTALVLVNTMGGMPGFKMYLIYNDILLFKTAAPKAARLCIGKMIKLLFKRQVLFVLPFSPHTILYNNANCKLKY
jgi:hypothetical protein